MENFNSFEGLKEHLGHVIYITEHIDNLSGEEELLGMALECENCDKILLYFENPELL